jgi:hypothetical protein
MTGLSINHGIICFSIDRSTKYRLNIINHGQYLEGECNKCFLLTLFSTLNLDVVKHSNLMRDAGFFSSIIYKSLEDIEGGPPRDSKGIKIPLDASIRSLLEPDSFLDINLLRRIEWMDEWKPYMIVLLTVEDKKLTDVGVYYHSDDKTYISEKKVIFLYLENSHFQGTKKISNDEIDVETFVKLVKPLNHNRCPVHIHQCNLRDLPILASNNMKICDTKDSCSSIDNFVSLLEKEKEVKSSSWLIIIISITKSNIF